MICRCEMRQTMDTIEGGLTETIFPKTGKKLTDPEYMEAFKFIALRKNINKYKSIMDFLFCETFPIPWKYKCYLYYNNIGLPLRKIDTFNSVYYDDILCNLLLELCKKHKQYILCWKELQYRVHDIITRTETAKRIHDYELERRSKCLK